MSHGAAGDHHDGCAATGHCRDARIRRVNRRDEHTLGALLLEQIEVGVLPPGVPTAVAQVESEPGRRSAAACAPSATSVKTGWSG